MTGIELAGILKDYSPWGLRPILMFVIAKLYADSQKLSTGYIERIIAGLDATTGAATSVQGALNELRNLMDCSGEAVGEHSHQTRSWWRRSSTASAIPRAPCRRSPTS